MRQAVWAAELRQAVEEMKRVEDGAAGPLIWGQEQYQVSGAERN
jgi:hypothetical protein